MTLPPDHPQRIELNDEVHARPPESLAGPLRVTFLALFSEWADRERELAHVAALAARFGAPPPAPRGNHYSADLGPFRVKWERHTEFARYKFIAPGTGAGDDPFADPALALVPADWLAGLNGQVIVAAHAALMPARSHHPDYEGLSAHLFAGNPLVGSTVAGGLAVALTDFRVHDGFSRLLVLDGGMTPRQAGRTVQRLLEIDTYRLMAMLALPVAREMTPFLSRSERELAEIDQRPWAG